MNTKIITDLFKQLDLLNIEIDKLNSYLYSHEYDKNSKKAKEFAHEQFKGMIFYKKTLDNRIQLLINEMNKVGL